MTNANVSASIGFAKREDETEQQALKRRIGETLGAVSVCWVPRPEGIFDASPAVDLTRELEEAVMPLLEHSIQLNQIGWKIAVALGDVQPGSGGWLTADIDELVDRLIAKADLQ